MLEGREIKRTSYLGQTKARSLRNVIGFSLIALTAGVYGGLLYYSRVTSKTIDDVPFRKRGDRILPDSLKEAYVQDQAKRVAELQAIQERRTNLAHGRKYSKE